MILLLLLTIIIIIIMSGTMAQWFDPDLKLLFVQFHTFSRVSSGVFQVPSLPK